MHTDTFTQDFQYTVESLNITGIATDFHLNFMTDKIKEYSHEWYYKNIPLWFMSEIYIILKEDFLTNNFKLPPTMQNVLQGVEM